LVGVVFFGLIFLCGRCKKKHDKASLKPGGDKGRILPPRADRTHTPSEAKAIKNQAPQSDWGGQGNFRKRKSGRRPRETEMSLGSGDDASGDGRNSVQTMELMGPLKTRRLIENKATDASDGSEEKDAKRSSENFLAPQEKS